MVNAGDSQISRIPFRLACPPRPTMMWSCTEMPSGFAASTTAGATTNDLHQRGFVAGFRPFSASQPRNPRTSLTKRAQAGSRGSST
jgi:hypothetical protein